MMKKPLLFILLVLLLASCKPSEEAIQKAIEQTQSAVSQTQTAEITPTPKITSTPTKTPTPTKAPCSNEGWSELFIYVDQYERTKSNIQVGDSIAVLLEQLTTIKNMVDEVNVSACSQYAKQKYLEYMDYDILGSYALGVTKDYDSMADYMIKGFEALREAGKELEKLGISK